MTKPILGLLILGAMPLCGQQPKIEDHHNAPGGELHYDCAHPWQVRFGKDSRCYWNSYEWYPASWDVLKDFMSRSTEKELAEEKQVDHWGISYKFEGGYDGDCGFSVYLVTYHNTAHITDQPAHRYYRLSTGYGSGDRGTVATVNLEYAKEDATNPEWKGVK